MFLYCSRFFFFFFPSFFFFNDTATTEIYTLSLHDALPILSFGPRLHEVVSAEFAERGIEGQDRKSTRLNSSHTVISYAVFCLKNKKQKNQRIHYDRLRQNCFPHQINDQYK